MSEKLTFANVHTYMENKMDVSLWRHIESDREAIRAEVREEVTEEILKDHFAMGEDIQVWNDMTKKWKDTTVWYNTAGCGADKPVVRRVPEPRPMTRDEKIKAIKGTGLFLQVELLKESTLDDLLTVKGIPTEVTE